MSALAQVATIARRELAGQRLALAAAAVAGLAVVAAPYLPWSGHASPDDARSGLAIGLLLPGLALYLLLLGATLVARDLAEGRLSFYFARPVSSWTLWLGKLAGATLAVIVATVIVAGPAVASALAAGRREWIPTAATTILLLVALPGALAAVHAAAVALRSRSAWLILDVIGLAVFLAVAVPALRHLVAHRADAALRLGLFAGLLAAAGVFLAVGGLALARGRTEPERVHRWSSLLLWPALVLVAFAFAGFARWTVTPPEPRLARIDIVGLSPTGDAVVVGGPLERRRYEAAFLIEPRTGDAHRLGALAPVSSSLAFSADGSTAAWMRVGRGEERRPVFTLDLASGEIRRTGVTLPRSAHLALSPDGELLTAIDGDQWTVTELDGGRTVDARRRPAGDPRALSFVSPSEIVLLVATAEETADGGRSQRSRVWKLDLASGALRRTLDLDVSSSYDEGLVLENGPVLLHHRDGVEVYDPRTGERTATLEVPAFSYPPTHRRRLEDGRWVIGDRNGDLVVVAPGGTIERRVDLGRGFPETVGPRLPTGELVVSVIGSDRRELPRAASSLPQLAGVSGGAARPRLLRVDLESGEQRLLGDGLEILAFSDGAPGRAARILVGGDDAIYWWDTGNDDTRLVLEAPRSQFARWWRAGR